MSEPTEKEIVEVLAKATGVIYDNSDMGSDGTIVCRAGFWNPLHSLDDMAEVEAKLEALGRYEQYYDLRQALSVKKMFSELKHTPVRVATDRQSASIRARAAYEVLKGEA